MVVKESVAKNEDFRNGLGESEISKDMLDVLRDSHVGLWLRNTFETSQS